MRSELVATVAGMSLITNVAGMEAKGEHGPWYMSARVNGAIVALVFMTHQHGKKIGGLALSAPMARRIERHRQRAGPYETAPNAHRARVDCTAIPRSTPRRFSRNYVASNFLESQPPA